MVFMKIILGFFIHCGSISELTTDFLPVCNLNTILGIFTSNTSNCLLLIIAVACDAFLEGDFSW